MTQFQKIALAICVVVGFILAIMASWMISEKVNYRKGYNDAAKEAKVDTVFRTDTIREEYPVEVTKWKDKIVYVPITQTDTIHQHDTTYIALQFEKKEYADTTYRAIVSGYSPSLDYIEVYQKTAYITNTIQDKRKWTFGVTLGPGVLYDGSFHGGMGLVAGLQYRF